MRVKEAPKQPLSGDAPHKVVIMDSKRERAPIDRKTFELGHQGIEAANKLRVLYLFEKDIRFTDSFKETIKTINEDDGHWADYNEIYEGLVDREQAQDVPQYDPLAYMLYALVELHLASLKLVYKDEDFEIATTFLYAFYRHHWEMLLEEATLNRDDWLPLMGIEERESAHVRARR